MMLKMLVCATAVALLASPMMVASRRVRHNFMHAPKADRALDLPEQWFTTQQVDHFDATNQAQWSQRYFVNDQYYTSGGPVFLMLGGEGTANPIWLTAQTSMVVYAQQFGAMMVLLEHRYYGESQPFEDLTTPNLRFLSSEQSLADAAVFHSYFTNLKQLPANTPWISFGGSYSGALSAWLRQKYPNVVVGAVASSAPVVAELDFSQYLDVVTASVNTFGGEACVNALQQASAAVASQLQSANGRASLSSLFQTCDPIGSDVADIANFAQSVAGNVENVCQYNQDNRAFEGAVDTNVTLSVVCQIMTDSNYTPLQRYANLNTLILNTYSETCLDASYSDFVSGMQNTTLEAGLSGGRQWQYQTCTEFGWYQSSDSTNQPFGSGFPIDFWTQQCSDIYGDAFTVDVINAGIAWTASNYGGLNIGATNIVLPNGSIDPWHNRGILSNVSPTVNAVFIDGSAHCGDMYPADSNDSPQMVAARKYIGEQIAQFIASASAAKQNDAANAKAKAKAGAKPRARHYRKSMI